MYVWVILWIPLLSNIHTPNLSRMYMVVLVAVVVEAMAVVFIGYRV